MARKIDKIPDPERLVNSPYRAFMDGSLWEFKRGTDFVCEPWRLSQSLRNVAYQQGWRARIYIYGDKVYFQVRKQEKRGDHLLRNTLLVAEQ